MTLEKLEDFKDYFYSIEEFFITDITEVNSDNLFVHTILVRAHEINKGFIELTNSGNYLCAAPLVRMQLETVCRCYARLLTESPKTYIERYFGGMKLDNHTYKSKQLTYTTLIKLLSDNMGLTELARIYKEGNAFIHPTDITYKASILWNKEAPIVRCLDGKFYDDSQMEAIKKDMYYVNYCYVGILEAYKLFFSLDRLAKDDKSRPDYYEKSIEATDRLHEFITRIKGISNEPTE